MHFRLVLYRFEIFPNEGHVSPENKQLVSPGTESRKIKTFPYIPLSLNNTCSSISCCRLGCVVEKMSLSRGGINTLPLAGLRKKSKFCRFLNVCGGIYSLEIMHTVNVPFAAVIRVGVSQECVNDSLHTNRRRNPCNGHLPMARGFCPPAF